MSEIRVTGAVPCDWQTAARAFLPREARLCSVQRMSGGFSGAVVLKVETGDAAFILRKMSSGVTEEASLRYLHRWLRQLHEQGLPVAVPLCQPRSNSTAWIQRDWIWQMEPCLPGASLDGNQLSPVQLQNLMQTVAKLHLTSATLHRAAPVFPSEGIVHGVPHTVRSRLQILQSWTPERMHQAYVSLPQASKDLRPLLEACLAAMVRHRPAIQQELESCLPFPVPLHPCVRDLWQSNILFEGDHVSGVIDPHSTRVDHVSTDLSRLLGSFFGDDSEKRDAALAIYEELRPLSAVEHLLVRTMDRSAVLLTSMTWVARWMEDRCGSQLVEALIARLKPIARRLPHL